MDVRHQKILGRMPEEERGRAELPCRAVPCRGTSCQNETVTTTDNPVTSWFQSQLIYLQSRTNCVTRTHLVPLRVTQIIFGYTSFNLFAEPVYQECSKQFLIELHIKT